MRECRVQAHTDRCLRCESLLGSEYHWDTLYPDGDGVTAAWWVCRAECKSLLQTPSDTYSFHLMDSFPTLFTPSLKYFTQVIYKMRGMRGCAASACTQVCAPEWVCAFQRLLVRSSGCKRARVCVWMHLFICVNVSTRVCVFPECSITCLLVCDGKRRRGPKWVCILVTHTHKKKQQHHRQGGSRVSAVSGDLASCSKTIKIFKNAVHHPNQQAQLCHIILSRVILDTDCLDALSKLQVILI